MDRRLLKPLLLITVVLIMPLVLLATRGESFAAYVDAWRTNPPPRATLAALVVAVLASDIVLPVPSGPVSTLAGSQLGVLLGTLTSTVGMTLGAGIAFALARGVRGFSRGSTDASATSQRAPALHPIRVRRRYAWVITVPGCSWSRDHSLSSPKRPCCWWADCR